MIGLAKDRCQTSLDVVPQIAAGIVRLEALTMSPRLEASAVIVVRLTKATGKYATSIIGIEKDLWHQRLLLALVIPVRMLLDQ